MADKLAATYRYVKKDGDSVSRVILRAGDDVPKDLSKKERDRLKKDGLIVDSRRLSSDNLRLPYGHPDAEVETSVAGGPAPTTGETGGPGAANESDGRTDAEKAEAEAKAKDAKGSGN